MGLVGTGFPQICLSVCWCGFLLVFGWIDCLIVALRVLISSFELFAGLLLLSWFCEFWCFSELLVVHEFDVITRACGFE